MLTQLQDKITLLEVKVDARPTLCSSSSSFDLNRGKSSRVSDTSNLCGLYFQENGPSGTGTVAFDMNISSQITRTALIKTIVDKKSDSVTKLEIQQLLGHFCFAGRIIEPGRIFLSYLL